MKFSRILYKIMLVLVAIVFIVATFNGAMAMNFEEKNPYKISPDSEISSQIILYDIPHNSSPDITSTGNFLYITNEEKQGNMLIISFNISVPNNAEINIYEAELKAVANNITANTTIDMYVQKSWANKLGDILRLNYMFFIGLFLVLGIIFGTMYLKHFKKKVHKKKAVIFIIVLSMILGIIVILSQSNMIIKHGGTNFSKSFSVQAKEGSIVTLQLARNSLTPEVLDWATFQDTNQTYIYYSLDGETITTFVVDFSLPEVVEKDKYYLDINIIEDGKKSLLQNISFYAR